MNTNRKELRFRFPRASRLPPRLGLLTLLITMPLLAEPLQHPKRWISSYTIDLAPLFKWWPKRQGPRPLAAWVHITGSIVSTNAGAWVLDARIEPRKSPSTNTTVQSIFESARIILRTPPIDELTQFERLRAQFNILAFRRTSLAEEANRARDQDHAVVERLHAVRADGAQYLVLLMEDRRLRQLESEAQAQVRVLDQQIREVRPRLTAYPDPDRYLVDCFALDLEYAHDRMPVYDYGRVLE